MSLFQIWLVQLCTFRCNYPKPNHLSFFPHFPDLLHRTSSDAHKDLIWPDQANYTPTLPFGEVEIIIIFVHLITYSALHSGRRLFDARRCDPLKSCARCYLVCEYIFEDSPPPSQGKRVRIHVIRLITPTTLQQNVHILCITPNTEASSSACGFKIFSAGIRQKISFSESLIIIIAWWAFSVYLLAFRCYLSFSFMFSFPLSTTSSLSASVGSPLIHLCFFCLLVCSFLLLAFTWVRSASSTHTTMVISKWFMIRHPLLT